MITVKDRTINSCVIIGMTSTETKNRLYLIGFQWNDLTALVHYAIYDLTGDG